MLSKVITGSISGISVEKVVVETDFSQGLPYLSLVGLPDATVKESKERIRSAIINSGYAFPMKRITINLWPADTRKSGSHFDLPLSVGIISATGQIQLGKLEHAGFMGELSLDGSVNKVDCCLALVLGLKEHGIKEVYLPKDNLDELMDIDGIKIYGVENLYELIDHLTGLQELRPARLRKNNGSKNNVSYENDYSDIRGQESGKRAMEICAAGWHDILLTGPPGAGKTMLASRLNTILPEPSNEELMEINKIHSIAGGNIQNLDEQKRPFRAPHHTVTSTSLMGGGVNPRPGELSLAHLGVLFLDELPEFERRVLDMLRQPLEDGFINLSRLSGRHTYPCKFILVAAMNPCPCGYYGDPHHTCTCNTGKRIRYSEKISGPLKDRIDLHVKINPVDYSKIKGEIPSTVSSSEMKKNIAYAVNIQKKRYKGESFNYNSQITDQKLDEYCALTENGKTLLKDVTRKFGLSARSVTKIKKVGRTIADLDGSEFINEMHIAEATAYRDNSSNEEYKN